MSGRGYSSRNWQKETFKLTNYQLAAITELYLTKLDVGEKTFKNIASLKGHEGCPKFLREKRGLITSPKPLSSKKAFFIIGAAGSGKSYVQRYLFSAVPDFQYYLYNPDVYIELLMEEHRIIQQGDEDYVKASPKKESLLREVVREVVRGELTEEALNKYIEDWKMRSTRWFLSFGQSCSMEDFQSYINKGSTIVVDRPGDSLTAKSHVSPSVMDQINMLRANDYTVYMIVVYSSKEESVARNAKRARSLPEKVVKDIWDKLFLHNKLANAYNDALKDNLIVINNKSSSSPLNREDLFGKKPVTLSEARDIFKAWLS